MCGIGKLLCKLQLVVVEHLALALETFHIQHKYTYAYLYYKEVTWRKRLAQINIHS